MAGHLKRMNISDLSPAALKQLEAKLEADLVLVRKVLALLEEHVKETSGAGVVAPVPVPVARVPQAAVPPPRDVGEVVREAVAKLDGIITMASVKAAMVREPGRCFDDPEVRAVLNALVRKGVLAVAKANTGRAGSTYRRL